MAVQGIGNLINNLANPLPGQTRDTQAANPPATPNVVIGAAREDTFTPSTQNNSAQATAQDAGIFQVSQVALTAVTANILLGQATLNANQNGAPTQAVSATSANPGTPQTVAATDSTTPVSAAQRGANSSAAPSAAAVAEAAANVQNQVQALNAALPALGLTNAEIQLIDRIAGSGFQSCRLCQPR